MKKSKTLVVLALVLTCLMVFAACTPATTTEEAGAAPAEAADTATADEAADEPADEAAEPTTKNVSATGASASELPTYEDITIPEGKTIKVGYLAQNESLQYCINMSDALRDEAAKYGAQVELEMVDSRGLIPQQISQAEDMVVKDMDVIILHPNDQDASAPALDIIVDAGVPLVILNTSTNNVEISDSYVGVDDEEAGIMLVKLMSQALGDKGTVNVMKGMLGDPANEHRMIGMEQELENHPDIVVGSAQAADWDRGKAMSLTEDWLTGGREFDGIISMNDEMAISAALALQSVGVTDVAIVGVDALDEALEMIKAGTMYGTVFQNADAQGRGALNVAVKVALGEDVEKVYTVPYEMVTAENVDDYLA